MKDRSILVLALVVLAVCGGAIWFLQMQSKGPVPEAGPAAAPPATAPGATAPEVTRSDRPPSTTPEGTAVAPTPRAPAPEWEHKIEQIIGAKIGETEAAQALINMLPTLPPEGQSEAAEHISNLILDPEYKRVLPLVKNPALPEEVLDVFMTDLMNRDDAVKLPALLEVAKLPNHPFQEEAKTDLELFLDDDHGTNWPKWEAAMKEYLQKQAAENAAAAAEAPPAPGQ